MANLCGACGARVGIHDNFCKNCGVKLRETDDENNEKKKSLVDLDYRKTYTSNKYYSDKHCLLLAELAVKYGSILEVANNLNQVKCDTNALHCYTSALEYCYSVDLERFRDEIAVDLIRGICDGVIESFNDDIYSAISEFSDEFPIIKRKLGYHCIIAGNELEKMVNESIKELNKGYLNLLLLTSQLVHSLKSKCTQWEECLENDAFFVSASSVINSLVRSDFTIQTPKPMRDFFDTKYKESLPYLQEEDLVKAVYSDVTLLVQYTNNVQHRLYEFYIHLADRISSGINKEIQEISYVLAYFVPEERLHLFYADLASRLIEEMSRTDGGTERGDEKRYRTRLYEFVQKFNKNSEFNKFGFKLSKNFETLLA